MDYEVGDIFTVEDFNPRTHVECDSEKTVIHTLMISIPHIIVKTDAKKAWINP